MLSCVSSSKKFTARMLSRVSIFFLPWNPYTRFLYGLHQNCNSVTWTRNETMPYDYALHLLFFVYQRAFFVSPLSYNLTLGEFPAIPATLPPPPTPVGKYVDFSLAELQSCYSLTWFTHSLLYDGRLCFLSIRLPHQIKYCSRCVIFIPWRKLLLLSKSGFRKLETGLRERQREREREDKDSYFCRPLAPGNREGKI